MIGDNTIMTSIRLNICNHCGVKIEKKKEFESHLIICGIVQTAKKRETTPAPIPSVEDLYKVVCELAMKCEQLEKTVQSLRLDPASSVVAVKRKVKDIIGELGLPAMAWREWIKTLEIGDGVSHIMENSLTNTFCHILNGILSSSLIPFHKESKNIYAFDGESWSVCSLELFTELTMKIYSDLVDKLSIWGKEKKQQMRTDRVLNSQYEDAMTKVFEFNSATCPNKIRLEFIKT